MKTNSLFMMAMATTLPVLLARPSAGEEQNLEEARVSAMALAAPVGRALKERGLDAYPMLARFLETNDCAHLPNEFCDELFFRWLVRSDGLMTQTGPNPELMAATRLVTGRLLERNKSRMLTTETVRMAMIYLAQKGDGKGLAIMERYLADPYVRANDYLRTTVVGMPHRILNARVAGTNIVSGLFDRKMYPLYDAFDGQAYTTNVLAFMPSVANTGPQAAYVYQAFMQEIARHQYRYSTPGYPYCVVSNMPPSILTMRVWFDKGGNAVTDVDLAKYGISVPGLGLATNVPPLPAVVSVPKVLVTAKPAEIHRQWSWIHLAGSVVLGAGVLAALFLLTWSKRK